MDDIIAATGPAAVDGWHYMIGLLLLLAGLSLIVWIGRSLDHSSGSHQAAAARDRAIQMLREYESRLAALRLTSPVGVMLVEADGRCLYSNRRLRQMIGRPHRDLAGMGWLDGVHPEDRENLHRQWCAAAATGRPFRLEYRLQTPDGQVRWVLGQAETRSDDDGAAGGFVLTATEITERKQAEEALEESERELRKAQRLAGIGNWERDLRNDRIVWSDQVYAIYGMAPQSVQMTLPLFLERVHPEDREEVQAAVAHSLATGEPYRKSHRITRPSGEVRVVQHLAEVTRNAAGEPVRFFGTVQDVTEIRRAENALRRSEAWFRTGFVAGGAGLVVADARGGYLQANPAFCRLVGYSEEELRGMYTRDVTHPEDRDSHEAIWERLVNGRSEVNAREKRYRTKSGDTVWAITAAAVFQDPADGETYVISNIQDITERKLAEQALAEREATLREAQKLANMGNWSRDLNTSVVEWSDEMYEIFEVDKNAFDVTYENFLSLVHPDDRNEAMARRRSGDQVDTSSSHSFRIVRPSGEIRYVRTVRRTETDTEGRPRHALGIMQDVTELRIARDALEASEARFRGVFEAGGAGIVVVDGEGRFHQINRAFADFVGYDEEDLAELTIFDILRHADHAELRGNRDSLFAGMVDRVSAVYRFAHWDGGARWGTVSAAAMKTSSAEETLMVLTVQDITRRVQADEALAQKTRLIDLINELTIAANTAIDFQEVVHLSLQRVCSFAGWPVGHAHRRIDGGSDFTSMRTWYLEDERRFAAYREITEALPSGAGHSMARGVLATADMEWRDQIPKGGGEPGPRARAALEAGLRAGFAVPVRAGDEVVAVLEFLSDRPIAHDDGLADAVLQIGTELGRVYERQRSETALRRREEQFSQIIDNAPLWIFVKDRTGRYLVANKAIAAAYGLSPDQMVGRTQADIYDHPEELARVHALDAELVEGGVSRKSYTSEFHTPSGDIRTLRIIKVPFTTQEGDTAVLGMAADITDEKRAEAELRKGQRMDALGHMTGGVAHDFNNLLTIILGNLQLLVRRLEEPATRTLAETAERAAKRGADMTRRLLAFARSQPLEPQPIDVNALIAEMVALVERTLGAGIEIRRRLVDGLWTTMADPAQVENALINLVVNARDAMPDGGTVTLSTANVTVGRASLERRIADIEPGDYVRVAVRDTGVGMTEETAARALEPFFTTKEVGKGSGLGLSSIYGFARQSGGGVRIQTEPGKGTKVSIFLPRCAAASVKDETGESREAAMGRQETVLLVEDEPDVRAFAAQALEAANYRVIAVGDARVAMDRLRQGAEPIDVLFSDIVLPGDLDGWNLAEAARALFPGLKVILTSGNWEMVGKEPPRIVSDAAFLQKPYSHQELAALLRSTIRSDPGKRQSK